MAGDDHSEAHDPLGLLEHVATSLGRHFYTYVFRPDGTFETVFEIGAAWEEFLGGGVPEGVDDDAAWMAAVHPDDRELYESLDAPIRRGEPVDAQYRLIGFDGKVRWVEVHERARHAGDGRIVVDGVVSDITSRKETELALAAALRKADRIARVDGLTGAYNRRHVSEVLDAELARATRSGEPVGLLLLDLDHFKSVNDHHGHAGGDEVLREVTRRLAAAVRNYDTVGRWGGEEFVVIVPGMHDDDALRTAAEAVRGAIRRAPFALGDELVVVTGSVGAARAEDGQGGEELVAAADRALYTAKRRGRDRVELASEIADEAGAGDDVEALRVAQALASASSVREGVSPIHDEQVARLAGLIAEELALPAELTRRVRLGGWLHDVGKVAVSDRILTKPAELDAGEWAAIRTHSEIGEELIRRIPALAGAARAVRHHHERWDGQGYPDGLAGEAIPLEARIVAAADTYCAITDDRIFRTSRSHDEAIRELQRSAGTQLDPWVVTALVRTLERERGRIAELLRGVA
jgi:diguanylate cyclase (GGDEF)-like protein/PAS domain S-box-containing protein